MSLKQMLLKVWCIRFKMETKEAFLTLVRLGIGTETVSGFTFQAPIDWHEVKDLATQQGLYAIVLDGFEKLPTEQRPSQELLLGWIGEVLQGYEFNFEQYKRTLGEMAAFYSSHGYKMMVLKGYACALNWPKPEHRPCGDIDIWQFGKQKEADALITTEKGIKVDKSHHHHTVFNWGEFTVENHYDFVNVHARKSNRELEKIFKELGTDDSHRVEVNGEKVYFPSPNLHALFLMRHAVAHFSSTSITLRQVLDWAFFVEKNKKEIDWKWFLDMMKEYHIMDFFNTINAICVEELGFESSIFPRVQYNPFLKDKVLADIINPKYSFEEPKYMIPRLVYKYKRWKGNSWKHEICYNESMWSAFWSGFCGHLLKPASI